MEHGRWAPEEEDSSLVLVSQSRHSHSYLRVLSRRKLKLFHHAGASASPVCILFMYSSLSVA
jgi:hypothetical protein